MTLPEEPEAGPQAEAGRLGEGPSDFAELWRIELSLAAVTEEMHRLRDLDDARLMARVAALERGWRTELEQMLPESLHGELHRLLDWLGKEGASASELRVGLAQLEGWVSGILHSIGVVALERSPEG